MDTESLMIFLFSKVADELRKAIFEEAGLTCSAGVAPNRMLAKVIVLAFSCYNSV